MNDEFVSLVQADVLALPLANSCCDAVCNVGLLEHFTEHELREQLLPEVHRVLRKGGVMLVHVPVRSVATRLVRFWRRNVTRTLSSQSIDDDNDPTHRIWWSPVEYRQFLNACGFAVLSAGHYPYRSSREPRLFSLGTTMLHHAANTIHRRGLPLLSRAAERLLTHTAFASYYIARPYEVL